jgi:hypothetical protein
MIVLILPYMKSFVKANAEFSENSQEFSSNIQSFSKYC